MLLRVISGLGNEFLNLLLKCTFDLGVALLAAGYEEDSTATKTVKEMEMVETEREREVLKCREGELKGNFCNQLSLNTLAAEHVNYLQVPCDCC